MSKLERVSLTIPTELLQALDRILKSEGYVSRSEAVRDAITEFVSERAWRRKLGGQRRGVIVFVYNHEVRGLSDRLLHIQHQEGELIVSTLHWHVDEKNCLEVLLVKGRAQQITRLAERLEALRGVKQLRLVVLDG